MSSDITDAGPRLKAMNDALAEIARLHAANDRLRAEIERLRSQVFSPLKLTDAEREALEVFLRMCGDPSPLTAPLVVKYAAALRGLLERHSAQQPERG